MFTCLCNYTVTISPLNKGLPNFQLQFQFFFSVYYNFIFYFILLPAIVLYFFPGLFISLWSGCASSVYPTTIQNLNLGEYIVHHWYKA